MSQSVYSEINFHITWHTKNNLPLINEQREGRLYHYLTHKILETPPGAILHAICTGKALSRIYWRDRLRKDFKTPFEFFNRTKPRRKRRGY